MGFPAIAGKNEPRVSVLADSVYRYVAPLENGSIVTYQDLRKVLFENPQSRRCNAAIHQAGKRLLRENQKLLVNVRGVGYQIAMPNEHAVESKRVQGHARRRLRRSLEIAANAEMEKLTSQERQQVEEQCNRVRLILAAEKNIAKAKILPNGDVTVPAGKRLAALLLQSPSQ